MDRYHFAKNGLGIDWRRRGFFQPNSNLAEYDEIIDGKR
jgi:hypothetical protein